MRHCIFISCVAPLVLCSFLSHFVHAATLTVGSGCTHSTIAAAIAAAPAGSTIRIEGGVTFTENLTVPDDLIIEGGYAGCASGSTARTIINGGAAGSVFDIWQATTVSLRNLDITNGLTGSEGGGVRFARGDGTGSFSMSNVHVYGNTGTWGGGVWVGRTATLTTDNVHIYNNSASIYGGGVRLYGGDAVFTASSIHDNTAPLGGGLYMTLQGGTSPTATFLADSDVYGNTATSDTKGGGGVFVSSGQLNLKQSSEVYWNTAHAGAGVYLDSSTLTITDKGSGVTSNTADTDGGGVFAVDSQLRLRNQAAILSNMAGAEANGAGGGAYLNNTDFYVDKGAIIYNSATGGGGGVYAGNGTVFDMDLGAYTCVQSPCSALSYNTSGGVGGGALIEDGMAQIDDTYLEGNQAQYGGALFVTQSSLGSINSVYARNDATMNTGDAVYVSSSGSFSGYGLTFAYNDLNGASTGTALAISTGVSATGELYNSIIWGHTQSVAIGDTTGLTVTCSDVEGGYTGSGNIDTDPLFANRLAYDYHLQATSPTVDRCTLLHGSTHDVELDIRPYVYVNSSSPYDMGADEFTVDSDSDGLPDVLEQSICTNPLDADTDDDGLLDGEEDVDRDGVVDTHETNPCDADSDDDRLQDGTEVGVEAADVGADTGAGFEPDLDPFTTTDPLNPDSDYDNLLDGAEDANHNGRLDAGERDPLVADTICLPWMQMLLE